MHRAKMPGPRPEADEYLRKLSPRRRTVLAQSRSLILETVPAAAESMRHKMPAYDCEGATLCAFASQKQYTRLYVDPNILLAHRMELHHLNVGKSCTPFQSLDQLPLKTMRTARVQSAQTLGSEPDRSLRRAE